MYGLGPSARMWWGKVRRAFLIAFRKKRVAGKLERRRGACTRCGACCKIVFRCPAYDDSNGEPRCLIYDDRPGVCGLFPLDEKDLRDRDIVMPDRKCGFFFSDEPDGNGSPPGEAMPQPIRWGPSKGAGGSYSGVKGTLKILWSFVRKPGTDGNGRHGD